MNIQVSRGYIIPKRMKTEWKKVKNGVRGPQKKKNNTTRNQVDERSPVSKKMD
jgi:hypothetical protein